MNLTKKLLSCILVVLMLLAVCSCKVDDPINKQTTPPTTEPTPTASLDPATEQELIAAKEALSALDRQLFLLLATSDGISAQLLIDDNAAFGITEPITTLGTMLQSDDDPTTQDYIAKLQEINYSVLSGQDLITYRFIERLLSDSESQEAFDYMYEPLTPYTGLQCNLPLNLALLPMENEEDVELYLALLSDCERYLGEVITYEREKSENGTFMIDEAADLVIADCESFIQGGENSFVIASFEEALSEIDGISDDKVSEYVDQCREIVTNSLIPAYNDLKDCITSLKGTGADSGLRSIDGGREYFANELRIASCGNLLVSDAFDLLENTLDELYGDFVKAALLVNFDELLNFNFTKGSVDENIEYLKTLISSSYPSLPEHMVDFMEIPEELSEALSPAAYLIPPIDDAYHNLILLNPASISTSNAMLSLLAHEGYPGHMYQYVYQRELKDTGLLRNIASLTAYYEGWSQAAEEFVYENASFNTSISMLTFTDSMMSGVILPAMISIGYNYYDWEAADILALLEPFGITSQEFVDYTILMAQAHPMYFLEYALGYAQYNKLNNDYKEAMKAAYDPLTWHKAYLDVGPAYFDQLRAAILPGEIVE